jgi:hypothetical protein
VGRSERRMIPFADVVVQPVRRHLDREQVHKITRTLRQHGMTEDTLGAVVAYRRSVGWVLLGGEHRMAAASAPGAKGTFIVVRSWEEFAAWMAVDATDPRRTPMDPVAATAFYERAIGALKPNRGEKAPEDVAEYTGVHRQVIDNIRFVTAVIRDADEPVVLREFAQAKLDEVEAGKFTGHGVREAVNRQRAKLAEGDRPVLSAFVQRKALGSIAQITGMIDALAGLGPINPELPQSEREEYAKALGSLGAKLSKIKANLRGDAA